MIAIGQREKTAGNGAFVDGLGAKVGAAIGFEFPAGTVFTSVRLCLHKSANRFLTRTDRHNSPIDGQ